ncbi:hypothetical protein ACS0TY_006430 [Phlomoides rotata]
MSCIIYLFMKRLSRHRHNIQYLGLYMSASDLTCFLLLSFTFQSLKSRGIRFPGRDTDCLAPIFTPPISVVTSELIATLSQPAQRFSAEQIKEAFNVARNSTELLNTVLSSSPNEDVLKDDLTTTLYISVVSLNSQVQTIIETAGENEAVFFEVLNMNDEIQKVLSKYNR